MTASEEGLMLEGGGVGGEGIKAEVGEKLEGKKEEAAIVAGIAFAMAMAMVVVESQEAGVTILDKDLLATSAVTLGIMAAGGVRVSRWAGEKLGDALRKTVLKSVDPDEWMKELEMVKKGEVGVEEVKSWVVEEMRQGRKTW